MRIIRRIAVVVAPLLATALLSGTEAHATPSPAVTKGCAFIKNVYSVSPSVLRRCGYIVIPRQRVFTLSRGAAAGATVYEYDHRGHQITFLIPPPGFNPFTASPATLKQYGIPGKAELGDRLWARMMRRLNVVVPPRYLVAGGPEFITCTANSACWSGYVNNGSNTYTGSEAAYTEPSIRSSSCSNTAEGIWAGLGGDNTDNLGQAGTGYGLGHPHTPWFEVIVDGVDPNGGPVYAGWSASAGDSMATAVTYNGTQYQFSVSDANGNVYSPHYTESEASLGTAEVIVEPPSGKNLANFSPISVSGAKSFVSSWTKMESLPNTKLTAVNPATGHALVTVGAFVNPSSNPSQWTFSQSHCD